MKVFPIEQDDFKSEVYPLRWSDVKDTEGIYAREADDMAGGRVIVMKSVRDDFTHLFFYVRSLCPMDVRGNATEGKFRRTDEVIRMALTSPSR